MGSEETKIKLTRWVRIESAGGDYLKGARIHVIASLVVDDGIEEELASGHASVNLGKEVSILEVMDAQTFTTESEVGMKLWMKAVEKLYADLKKKQDLLEVQTHLALAELPTVQHVKGERPKITVEA
jgi:hypothetical protein